MLSTLNLTARLLRQHGATIYWEDLACKRLLYAVLERALLDIISDRLYLKPSYDSNYRHSQSSYNARTALQWIMDDSRYDISSYNRIMAILGIDKDLLRNPKILAKVLAYYSAHGNKA